MTGAEKIETQTGWNVIMNRAVGPPQQEFTPPSIEEDPLTANVIVVNRRSHKLAPFVRQNPGQLV